jgi:hypothetical protein
MSAAVKCCGRVCDDDEQSCGDARQYLIDLSAAAWPRVSHDKLRAIAEALIRRGLLHTSWRETVALAIASDLAATRPLASIFGADPGEAPGLPWSS